MKTQLRQTYKEIRKNFPVSLVENKSKTIVRNLLQCNFFQKSQNIMCYLSFQNEVITDSVFIEAWAQNKTTAIPITHPTTKEITLSQFSNFATLELSSLKIRELPPNKRVDFQPQKLDLCIIPGIAFDRNGNRLGFGQGYYDRFLPKLSPNCLKIALAFSEQLSTTPLPTDTFDIPMDYIITENEIIQI